MNKSQIWVRVSKDFCMPENDFDTRIRIIFPNGTAEWDNGNIYHNWLSGLPCWHPGTKITQKEAIKLMKAYDRLCGWKTVKIGEI